MYKRASYSTFYCVMLVCISFTSNIDIRYLMWLAKSLKVQNLEQKVCKQATHISYVAFAIINKT